MTMELSDNGPIFGYTMTSMPGFTIYAGVRLDGEPPTLWMKMPGRTIHLATFAGPAEQLALTKFLDTMVSQINRAIQHHGGA